MKFLLYVPYLISVQLPQAVNGSDAFLEDDPYGAMMALIGMGIVFGALILLYLVFSNTPRLFRVSFREQVKSLLKGKKKEQDPDLSTKISTVPETDLTGEVNAAIAAAIHLYRSELHDYEDTVLTIKKVSRTYSPWSSKIYGLRHMPSRH